MSTLQESKLTPSGVDPHTVSISGYAVDECYGTESVSTTDPDDPLLPPWLVDFCRAQREVTQNRKRSQPARFVQSTEPFMGGADPKTSMRIPRRRKSLAKRFHDPLLSYFTIDTP